MPAADPAPHRVFVSAKAVYAWSLALLIVCGVVFVAPFFARHDLRTLRMSNFERFAALPVLLYGHELLHVVGFRIARGLAGDQISIRWSRRFLLPHVALRVPVGVRRLRFAALLPGVLTGVLPLIAGALTGHGKLVVLGALMAAAAGGDLAIVVAVRGLERSTLIELGADWAS